MIADYEIRNAAGTVIRTSPDPELAKPIAEELAERFDRVTVVKVVRYERWETIAEFLSERAKRAVA